MVECPLRAYCLGYIFPFSCESNLVQVKPSITFAIVHVREMGLKSLSTSFGGTIFGIGITIEDFKRVGTSASFSVVGTSASILLEFASVRQEE